MRSWIVIVASLIGLVAIDRLTKLAMMAHPVSDGPLLFPGVFEFVSHKNYGVLADIPVPQYLIVAITMVVIVTVGVALFNSMRRKEPKEGVALIILLAGAIGNLWDRLQYGFVYDWILLAGRSAINIADIGIAVGLVWYIGQRNVDERHEGPPSAWGHTTEKSHHETVIAADE